MAEEKHKKNNDSFEKNLQKDYVPTSKLGNLPVTNQVDEELKKQMDKTKKEIEKFQKELSKKFNYIEALSIIPAQASQKIEEEYEVPEEECKKKLIHILCVIPESHFKEIGQVRMEAIKISKTINDKLWIHLMTPVDIWNLGLDSKFDIVEALAMSFPIVDKGILGALRVTTIHKSLVLKKFEKYVSSYVIGGSLVRGETKATSDIDVGIIIDDTDVKRMPRLELKEKLRSIIYSYIQEAEAISGVKNKLSPQVWLMTEFWDGVKDAHPIFFTFIRDGIPLYDRGTFLPWKSLLRMGKIKPSPEAIDMFMSSGDKLEETINRRIFDVATLDLFWGISTPTQGLLMLYGLAPGNVYDTSKQFREIFVKKEKLIEEKYADILDEIFLKVWKAYEHGKLKPGDIDGKKLDRLAKNALDYMKRLKELRKQIEKRVQEKTIEQTYKDVFGMLESLLNKKSEAAILKEFENKLIKEGKFPPRFLDQLKFISKVKKDMEKEENPKTKKKKKKQIDQMTGKEVRHVEEARKQGAEIVNALIEYTQRCDFMSMDKTRFIVKAKDKTAEVFFLKDVFVVEGQKISKIVDKTLKESNTEELKKQLLNQQSKETKIDFKVMEVLKNNFGEFELIN